MKREELKSLNEKLQEALHEQALVDQLSKMLRQFIDDISYNKWYCVAPDGEERSMADWEKELIVKNLCVLLYRERESK